jgi:hypothetical protein
MSRASCPRFQKGRLNVRPPHRMFVRHRARSARGVTSGQRIPSSPTRPSASASRTSALIARTSGRTAADSKQRGESATGRGRKSPERTQRPSLSTCDGGRVSRPSERLGDRRRGAPSARGPRHRGKVDVERATHPSRDGRLADALDLAGTRLPTLRPDDPCRSCQAAGRRGRTSRSARTRCRRRWQVSRRVLPARPRPRAPRPSAELERLAQAEIQIAGAAGPDRSPAEASRTGLSRSTRLPVAARGPPRPASAPSRPRRHARVRAATPLPTSGHPSCAIRRSGP